MADVQIKEVFDTVRIPLIQPNPDAYQDGNLFNLTGIAHQHYLNCFPTVNSSELSQEQEAWISKRNGFFNFLDISSGITSSTDNWAVEILTFGQLPNTYVTAIYDNTNSKHVILAFDGNNLVVKIGEITGTASTDFIFLSELTIANQPVLGVVWHDQNFPSSSAAYYSTVTGTTFTASSLTQITDVDFPPNQTPAVSLRGPMIQIDATTYVLTLDGQIYGSDLNSITSWNALNVIRAIQYPDHGVALARYKHHLVCFGEESIEFFNDVGNPPPSSPLERTQQAFIKMGASGPKLICSVGDILFWVSSSESQTNSLYMLDGYTPVKLSTNREENLMGSGVNELRSVQFMNNQCLITDCTVTLGPENVANKYGSTYVEGASTASVFQSDPYGTFQDEFSNVLLAYNIESKSWWFYKHGYAGNLFSTNLLPIATNHASTAYLSNLGQASYTLFKNINPIQPAAIGQSVYAMLGDTNTSIGNYADAFLLSGVTTLNPITCAICTNTQMFGSEQLKRIHKLKVIQRIIQTKANDTYPNIWLLSVRDDWILDTDSASTRRMRVRAFTTSRDNIRVYWNNFGAGRQWGFCLISRSNISWQVKGLELDVSQGTR